MARSGLLFALSLGCGCIPAAGGAQEGALLPTASNASTGALAEAARLFATGQTVAARRLIDGLAAAGEGGTERDFLDGMISYSAKDYRRAETMFRRILDGNPRLVRVRLELARTLFMERKDDQADYHFSLAAAERPSALVTHNITRFREAIRARRALRFNVEFGFAPDSNINSATDKETVDIYGLPFRLDPSARARSGTGRFVGGDASMRLNRSGKLPLYLGIYGRWTRYRGHQFDDAYAGVEAGPEIGVAGGQLRTTATGLMRWYGKRPLVSSLGARIEYQTLIGDGWKVGTSLLVRHNDYARRRDVDGWDLEARATVSRPLGLTTLGFADAVITRSAANGRGQAFWRARVGAGVLKEVGWGLRPQLRVDVSRQLNDEVLAPFGERRQDLRLEGSFSIYKRDWNVEGFTPSISATFTRNRSSLPIYSERRLRAEVRLTRAF